MRTIKSSFFNVSRDAIRGEKHASPKERELSPADSNEIAFGPFVLQLDPPRLHRDGQPVNVPTKVLATMVALVARHGVAVSKEELLAIVWPDTIVEEANLSQNIYTIRKLLAHDFPGEQPIETIARFGYRFRLPVLVPGSEFEKTMPASAVAPEQCLPDERERSQRLASPEDAACDPARAPKRRSLLRWTFCLAALVVIFAGILGWRRHTGAHQEEPAAELARFTSNSDEDRVTAVAFSPDGELVAYADADGVVLRGTHDAAIYSLEAPPLRNIDRLAWFPDRLHLAMSGIAISGRPQVWKISVLQERPVLLRQDARSGTPSHDGRLVAFANADASELWVVGSSGQDARRVFSGGPTQRFPLLLWSSNDSGLLVERHSAPMAAGSGPPPTHPTRGFSAAYEQIEVATGKITALQTEFPMGDACLTSNSELLYTLAGPEDGIEATELWRVRVDPGNGALASSPEMIYHSRDALHLFNLSCDAAGRRVAVIQKQGPVAVYTASISPGDGQLSAVKRLSLDAEVAYPHGWTSDGRSVLYEAMRNNQMQIYSQALDRHDPQPIVPMAGDEFSPRLTPDHRWILFFNKIAPGAKALLYRVSTQGGIASPAPSSEEVQQFRCPMRAGTCIALRLNSQQQSVFSVLDPQTGLGRQFFTAPSNWGALLDWDVSPDGNTLVLLDAAPSGVPLHTVLLASGTVSGIPYAPDSRPLAVNWAADGHAILVANATAVGSDLFTITLQGTATLFRNASVGSWAVESPDGTHIAFVDRNLDSNVWLLDLAK